MKPMDRFVRLDSILQISKPGPNSGSLNLCLSSILETVCRMCSETLSIKEKELSELSVIAMLTLPLQRCLIHNGDPVQDAPEAPTLPVNKKDVNQ
jgi:hypothetical protein